MDNAIRTAKQEITEATKFLTWLRTEHHTTIAQLRQAHLDAYLSEGTTTHARKLPGTGSSSGRAAY